MIGRAQRAGSAHDRPVEVPARPLPEGRPSGTGARRSGWRFITIDVQGLRLYGKTNAAGEPPGRCDDAREGLDL
jgi:hypothetical protein